MSESPCRTILTHMLFIVHFYSNEFLDLMVSCFCNLLTISKHTGKETKHKFFWGWEEQKIRNMKWTPSSVFSSLVTSWPTPLFCVKSKSFGDGKSFDIQKREFALGFTSVVSPALTPLQRICLNSTVCCTVSHHTSIPFPQRSCLIHLAHWG